MKRNSLGVYAAKVAYIDGITCYPQPIIFMDEASAIKTYLEVTKDITECRLLAIYKIADFDPFVANILILQKERRFSIMRRKKLPYKQSLKKFKNGYNQTKLINSTEYIMRGGIRL